METYNNLPDNFWCICKQVCPGFNIDSFNKNIVEGLYKYFIRHPTSPYNLNKGIWLEGDLGTGKSTLLYVFSKYMIALRRGFLVYDSPHIPLEYAAGDDLDKYTYARNSYPSYPVNMAFDELGREQIPAYYYKNELNVMQYILQIRYTLWQKQNVLTYITTNLDADEVEQNYGDFIRDRRKEMFNIIPLVGKSRR